MQPPIFILGIMPRSGTNFLSDLLCLHPDCGKPGAIGEDFITASADRLQDYVDVVSDRWSPNAQPNRQDSAPLLQAIGNGISGWLADRTDAARVVTKTPYVTNLELFFSLFPQASLLIIVRDGRAVVESGVRSFGWYREIATHRWATAARAIDTFDKAHRDTQARYRIVQYERLFTDTADEMRAILEFLQLDADTYDFEGAANLPIRGSSEVREGGPNKKMNWAPVERTRRFDPLARADGWSRVRHERFNWIAGAELRALGYEERQWKSGRILWGLWNLILDLRWGAMRAVYPLARHLIRLPPGTRRSPAPRHIDR